MKAMHWIFIGLASAIAAQAAAQFTLMHVHGLAYSPDGKRLMIPIATFAGSVHLSKDGARTWNRIVERGRAE